MRWVEAYVHTPSYSSFSGGMVGAIIITRGLSDFLPLCVGSYIGFTGLLRFALRYSLTTVCSCSKTTISASTSFAMGALFYKVMNNQRRTETYGRANANLGEVGAWLRWKRA